MTSNTISSIGCRAVILYPDLIDINTTPALEVIHLSVVLITTHHSSHLSIDGLLRVG